MSSSFTNFGLLPVEIQVRIFKFINDEPRIYKFVIEPPSRRSCVNIDRNNLLPPPVLLHVSAKSRIETIKILEWNLDAPTCQQKAYPKFFRDDVDIVYVHDFKNKRLVSNNEWVQELSDSRDVLNLCENWQSGPFYQPPRSYYLPFFKTLAFSRKIWDNFPTYGIDPLSGGNDFTKQLLSRVRCQSLIFVIEDKSREYWRMKIGKKEWQWMTTEMNGVGWEDNMAIPKGGELSKVVYNTDYAQHLEGEFASMQKYITTYLETSVVVPRYNWWIMEKFKMIAAMEFRVLSS